MDIGPDPRGYEFLTQERRPDDLWGEHGWALTGPQTGGILAIVTLACLVLKVVGG